MSEHTFDANITADTILDEAVEIAFKKVKEQATEIKRLQAQLESVQRELADANEVIECWQSDCDKQERQEIKGWEFLLGKLSEEHQKTLSRLGKISEILSEQHIYKKDDLAGIIDIVSHAADRIKELADSPVETEGKL